MRRYRVTKALLCARLDRRFGNNIISKYYLYFLYLGIEYSRKSVRSWVQKTDLQPVSGKVPNQIAVEETVIRINYQQF